MKHRMAFSIRFRFDYNVDVYTSVAYHAFYDSSMDMITVCLAALW